MIVLVGVGQLGGVFGRGLLRLGRPIVPIVRGQPWAPVVDANPSPELVLVTVQERDLAGALATVPEAWRDRVGLVQNELLPSTWRAHGLVEPTVVAVWFEKRKTFEARVLRPSPVCGPSAALLVDALSAMDVPAEVIAGEAALLFELVVKNVYILAKNAAGLAVGGTGRELWASHAPLAAHLVDEALTLQTALTETTFDRTAVLAGVRRGFDGGPDQANAGRSAPARVARAVALADRHRLPVPTLRRLAAEHPR